MTDKNDNYKNTLNLPSTAFPMKANLPQREPKLLEHWDNINIYQKIREFSKGRPNFTLHDGPPYANGNIHLGHALNKVLKDIIIKFKTLNGYDCPYVPGWDCHGLPIEREVEKKKGTAGTKLSYAEFRKSCREYADKQVDGQRKDFIRLGVFGDWQNPYKTMNYKYEADIIRALNDIYKNGHLIKGYKPVHWCTACSSSLAEAEVEYANKTSPSIDVKFTVTNKYLDKLLSKFDSSNYNNSLGEGDLSVIIWTTTPWTLPANEAVAVHKDYDYVLVQAKFNNNLERFIVAKELLSSLSEKYKLELEVLAEAKGSQLELIKLEHPFEDREVPVVIGDHVTLDGGTGCVHTAPGHGPDDYLLGVKYGLPVDHEVNARGVFNAHVPFVGGEFVFKANDIIIDVLKNNNKLVALSHIEHSYPHCWRHKQPIIFRATPQWFVSMSKQNLRQDALKSLDDIKWLPDWGLARIKGMVETRPDWCISRQRTWCVPMPLFVNTDLKELHPRTSEILDFIANLVEEQGIEAWYTIDRKAVLDKFTDNKEDIDKYEAAIDTLDVWFDSGVSHYAVVRQNPELQWPADLYLEGSDQHRGWFGSSLMTSVAIYKQAPYKQVITHGFIVDQHGRKMSKSLGNTVLPQDVNNKWGADILRLWIAAADYRSEITVSEEIFKRTADVYRRIRNTVRFLLSNLNGFDPNKDLVDTNNLLKLDLWAIKCANKTQQDIIACYDAYNFRGVYQKIHDFCSINMGSFYLDIIKDRQYTTKENSNARRSAQTAMYSISLMLTKWMAPILSFTAEEVWQNLSKISNSSNDVESVFVTLYDNIDDSLELNKSDADKSDNFSLSYWDEINKVKIAVNKHLESLRAEGIIGSSLQAEVTIYARQDYFDKLRVLQNELRFILITSTAEVKNLAEINTSECGHILDTDLDGIKLSIHQSEHNKCVRCWHYSSTVGQSTDYSDLCARCIENIDPNGLGEERLYA